MDLLGFAKGPALEVAMTVFVAGVVWRLLAIALLRGRRDLSRPRHRFAAWKGVRLIGTRSWPRKEFIGGTGFGEVLGYTFHIGIFVALLLFLPHILFFQDILHSFSDLLARFVGFDLFDYVPFDWPYLPASVITAISAVSIGCLLVLFGHRLVSPVKRMISGVDDYLSWLVTIAPLVTGVMAFGHVGGPYQTLLGVHILTVDALLIWFPFGKLMHMFTMMVARGVSGFLFQRKGAAM